MGILSRLMFIVYNVNKWEIIFRISFIHDMMPCQPLLIVGLRLKEIHTAHPHRRTGKIIAELPSPRSDYFHIYLLLEFEHTPVFINIYICRDDSKYFYLYSRGNQTDPSLECLIGT